MIFFIHGQFFGNLLSYFQSQANLINAKADGSGIYENRSDIGTKREDILYEFLYGHLPRRCHLVKGGYVFDSLGNESKQIDLIVTNDLTLQFTQFMDNKFQKSFNCIEGCYSAISVKSVLDKRAFYESIDNMASIPLNKEINLNPLLRISSELLNEIPLRIIFAYKGDSVENIKGIIEDYRSKNANWSNNFPNMIIVNNSYFVWKVGSENRSDPDGNRIAANSLIVMSRSKYVGGMTLMHMLTKIQKISNIGPHILLDFEQYMSHMDLASIPSDEPYIDILKSP